MVMTKERFLEIAIERKERFENEPPITQGPPNNLCHGQCDTLECLYKFEKNGLACYCQLGSTNKERNKKIEEMIRIKRNLEQW